MSELDQLIDPPKKRVKRPKNYDNACLSNMAQPGDVVYLPSTPDVKMTVMEIHNCNRAAGHYEQEVSVQWLNTAGEITFAKLIARTLLM